MISTTLMLVLGLSASAQTVPAAPTPSDMAHDISARAEKDPAGANANLNDLFKQMTTRGTILPTWKEVQQDRAKRDFAGSTNDAPAEGGSILSAPRPQDYQIGYTRAAGDVSFSRPLPRVELGVGAAANDVYLGNQLLSRDMSASASMRINLARIAPKRKLFHAPTLVYTESDVTPGRTLVGETDYSNRQLVDAVTHPVPQTEPAPVKK